MPLNTAQQAAATAPHTEPLKIIAGAGTGKTETLAARFVNLVREGIAPQRILLLTFTEDAAAEMRARVMLRLREAALALPPWAMLNLWIATFHGFAMRLVQEYGFEIGVPPTPRLLSEDDQGEFWQTLREAVEAEPHLPNGYTPLDHTAYRWDTDETWNKALAVIGAVRRGGGTTAELAPHAALAAQQTTEFAAQRAQLVPLIEHCFAAYLAHLHGRGVLDYDELLQAALRLLQTTPAICTHFAAVMVDEFQDTNRPQLALLQQLQPQFSRTTVVGDPRQAIYGWNSARAESINEFPFQPEQPLDPYDLTENYRSHPAIVAVANLALYGSELGELRSLQPAARAARRSPALDELAVSLHLRGDVAAEAGFVAEQIRTLHERGLFYRDMGVLLRSRTQLTVLRQALQIAQIPYVVSGGTGFYLDPLVRLTASLLRLLADPADRAAWAHVLESPLVGLSLDTIAVRPISVADQSQEHAVPVFERWLDDPQAVPLMVPAREQVVERLQQFRTWFDTARVRWGLLSPGAYLEWLWQSSGMLYAAWSAADLQPRLVLRRLLRDADEYAAAHPVEGIAGFAALLQRRVQEQPRVALPTTPSFEAVEIATVHQAKGREWQVVFVFNTALPGLRSGQIDSVLWDEHWKLVISDRAGAKVSDDALQRLRDDLRRRKRNEERSIWYVALTRAQERLYILHSGCRLADNGFTDARDKMQRQHDGAAPSKADEAVHFFHELWMHIQAQPTLLNQAIQCEARVAGEAGEARE